MANKKTARKRVRDASLSVGPITSREELVQHRASQNIRTQLNLKIKQLDRTIERLNAAKKRCAAALKAYTQGA